MRLRSSDISARAVDGETIILDLTHSRYLTATGVGTRILELLAEERSLEELCAIIGEEYEVDPEVARRDTAQFVEELDAAGLLSRDTAR